MNSDMFYIWNERHILPAGSSSAAYRNECSCWLFFRMAYRNYTNALDPKLLACVLKWTANFP